MWKPFEETACPQPARDLRAKECALLRSEVLAPPSRRTRAEVARLARVAQVRARKPVARIMARLHLRESRRRRDLRTRLSDTGTPRNSPTRRTSATASRSRDS